MGEMDATDAGTLIGQRSLQFDVAFTSNLQRAWKTCELTLHAAGHPKTEVIRAWQLNERHYGLLQGHHKHSPDLIEAFGEDKLMDWRRSYDEPPPSLDCLPYMTRLRGNALKISTKNMGEEYFNHYSGLLGHDQNIAPKDSHPPTESLKQCEERAYGYWKSTIAPRVRNGERVLIVAHANTIRAMVKAIDNISDEDIFQLKVPNGIPLVYNLDENLKPLDVHGRCDLGVHSKYLVSAHNHGRMMEYERCVKKKLTAIFEYLDTDGDGKITPDCLSTGLIRLKTSSDESVCEFEIEELLRCIPAADESGGVNLKAFLDAEATILPSLTKLSLLQ
jgi:2,3-bisphosphoglycerate-dependent phosphoglycerate mutase